MRGGSIVATNISKEYGATVVLERLSLPRDRVRLELVLRGKRLGFSLAEISDE